MFLNLYFDGAMQLRWRLTSPSGWIESERPQSRWGYRSPPLDLLMLNQQCARDAGVERDETSAVSGGEDGQMPVSRLPSCLHPWWQCGSVYCIGEKNVARSRASQMHESLLSARQVGRDRRHLERDAHESQFSDGTRRQPVGFPEPGPPETGLGMVRMVRPDECDQHVYIRKNLHGKSARTSRTKPAGNCGVFAGTGNTGSPVFRSRFGRTIFRPAFGASTTLP